jgi:hypothetical protein
VEKGGNKWKGMYSLCGKVLTNDKVHTLCGVQCGQVDFLCGRMAIDGKLCKLCGEGWK